MSNIPQSISILLTLPRLFNELNNIDIGKGKGKGICLSIHSIQGAPFDFLVFSAFVQCL